MCRLCDSDNHSLSCSFSYQKHILLGLSLFNEWSCEGDKVLNQSLKIKGGIMASWSKACDLELEAKGDSVFSLDLHVLS